MKIQPAVKKETLHIAMGSGAALAVMLLVFALLGKFSLGVLASGLIGSALAVFSFFMLGLTVQKMAAQADEGRGRKMMQFSYSMRMLMLVIWLIVAISVPGLHWVAAALPLLFPRLTIAFMQITGVYKREAKTEQKNEQEAQQGPEGE